MILFVCGCLLVVEAIGIYYIPYLVPLLLQFFFIKIRLHFNFMVQCFYRGTSFFNIFLQLTNFISQGCLLFVLALILDQNLLVHFVRSQVLDLDL